MSSPASLPKEIHRSAERGELQKVVKWLRKGGLVDAHCPATTRCGHPTTDTLLHAAAVTDQLELVRELLKRGASVDLQTSLGITALMGAAGYGRLSIVLVLLQHSANPDLQDNNGSTALMLAAYHGHEACVQALLRAKANTELLDEDGNAVLQHAENKGHTSIAALLRQHATPPQPAAAAPAAPPDAGEPAEGAPASLPLEIFESAKRGELPKVVKWLRKGGLVNALRSAAAADGQPSAFGGGSGKSGCVGANDCQRRRGRRQRSGRPVAGKRGSGGARRLHLPDHRRDHERPRQHVGRVHLRARGHHGVAPHQGHLAEDGRQAGEQDALPEPQPSQHDPRLQRGGLGAFDSVTVAPGAACGRRLTGERSRLNMLRHAQKVRAMYTAVPEPGLVAGVPGPRWIARLVQGDTLAALQALSMSGHEG